MYRHHDLEYQAFPRDSFSHVHSSPPCTEYSCAKTVGIRDLFSADCLVERMLAIIAWLHTASYTIENPWGGRYSLNKRGLLDHLPHHLTSYCKYGFPYRNHTSIWSNLPLDLPAPCRKGSRCSLYNGKCHPTRAQRGSSANPTDRSHSLNQLHSLPPSLCLRIAVCAAAHASHS